MSDEQLEEAGVDRLEAAIFEQRRLAHMLRQRGTEIEALRDDRERIAARERKALEREEELRQAVRGRDEKLGVLTAELKGAQYEARRAERRLVKTEADAGEDRKQAHVKLKALEEGIAEAESGIAEAEEERSRLKDELREARQQRDSARRELTVVEVERGRLQRELEETSYAMRRATRRVARVEADAGEDRKRARLQLDSLTAELREGLLTREDALEGRQQALAERDEARAGAAESLRGIEVTARDLGRTQSEIEGLVTREREREALLAKSGRTLDEVSDHLSRVRDSRSWRWGQAFTRVLRAASFRRRSGPSALDLSLERLAAEEHGPGRNERRPS